MTKPQDWMTDGNGHDFLSMRSISSEKENNIREEYRRMLRMITSEESIKLVHLRLIVASDRFFFEEKRKGLSLTALLNLCLNVLCSTHKEAPPLITNQNRSEAIAMPEVLASSKKIPKSPMIAEGRIAARLARKEEIPLAVLKKKSVGTILPGAVEGMPIIRIPLAGRVPREHISTVPPNPGTKTRTMYYQPPARGSERSPLSLDENDPVSGRYMVINVKEEKT